MMMTLLHSQAQLINQRALVIVGVLLLLLDDSFDPALLCLQDFITLKNR